VKPHATEIPVRRVNAPNGSTPTEASTRLVWACIWNDMSSYSIPRGDLSPHDPRCGHSATREVSVFARAFAEESEPQPLAPEYQTHVSASSSASIKNSHQPFVVSNTNLDWFINSAMVLPHRILLNYGGTPFRGITLVNPSIKLSTEQSVGTRFQSGSRLSIAYAPFLNS